MRFSLQKLFQAVLLLTLLLAPGRLAAQEPQGACSKSFMLIGPSWATRKWGGAGPAAGGGDVAQTKLPDALGCRRGSLCPLDEPDANVVQTGVRLEPRLRQVLAAYWQGTLLPSVFAPEAHSPALPN